MSMPNTHLTDRALIRLSGADTITLLDSLLTQQISAIAKHTAGYAALLTPQGKVISAMIVYNHEGDILLETASDERDTVFKRLMMYKLRADVTISLEDDLQIIASPEILADATLSVEDPRGAALGYRSLTQNPSNSTTDRSAYSLRRYQLGIPEGAEIEREKDFWLETGAEAHNGVSFSKGCYVGQELTARMKHRTSVKKMIIPFTLSETGAKIGDEILSEDGKVAGTIRALQGLDGLALIRFERASGAASVNDKPISLRLPPGV